MSNNRNCKINFMTKEISVSKKFLNASSNPRSAECELLGSLAQRYPDYRITLMPTPITYNRPISYTYQKMFTFILDQDNATELLEEYERVRVLSRCQRNPYAYVLHWFKNRFAEIIDCAAC